MKTMLLLGVLIQLNMTALCQNGQFHLDYSFIGLGSNRFETFPKATVEGQTLFYKEKSDKRVMYRTQLKAGALDSIEQIISSIKDTAVERINPCILSGGVYQLNIVSRGKRVHFSLTNTFDSSAYKIVTILNEYLPQKYKLGMPLSRWQREQPCKDELRRRADSLQKKRAAYNNSFQQHGLLKKSSSYYLY